MIQNLRIYLSVFAILLLTACNQTRKTNDLGLNQSDMDLGGPIDVKVLQANTKDSSERYFSRIKDQLRAFCSGNYTLAIDYPRIPSLRTMGYTSSFYYHCWDIYLPFELKTEKGDSFLLVAQLSDGTPGNKHNVNQFHVLRIYIFDQMGVKVKQIENAG